MTACMQGATPLFFFSSSSRHTRCGRDWSSDVCSSDLLEDAELEGFRFHDLRHHFASRLVMAGADLYVVKELLGHATIAMTERYAHLAPEHKAAAVALRSEERRVGKGGTSRSPPDRESA